jgi:hypothetical protein
MILSIALILMTSGEPGGSLATTQIDARNLQTGEFVYRDSAKGKVLGESSISIRLSASDSSYHFSAQTTGYADQHWESVASPTLTPISAQLTFGKGPDQPKAFELHYANEKVIGFFLNRRSPEPKTQLPVNASIESNTVDQRIDWATVMAFDLRKGIRFRFNVYDPTTGSSEVRARVSPRRRIDVPAGSFHVLAVTYWVKKSTGAERYIVYATTSLPRLMVREDFPDGTISELVSFVSPGIPRPVERFGSATLPHPASLRTASTSLYLRSPACGSPCTRSTTATHRRDSESPSGFRAKPPINPLRHPVAISAGGDIDGL